MSILPFIWQGLGFRHPELESMQKQLQANRISAGRLAGQRSCRLQDLESQIAELELLCRTLFVYIKQSPSFDAARFYEAFIRIDALDGERDGKVTKRTVAPVRPVWKQRSAGRGGKTAYMFISIPRHIPNTLFETQDAGPRTQDAGRKVPKETFVTICGTIFA